ncbi:MAG TPA: hypothetical protein VGO93_23590 [Candidatus Xenobia bacterium]|jgi:hypothetical protein
MQAITPFSPFTMGTPTAWTFPIPGQNAPVQTSSPTNSTNYFSPTDTVDIYNFPVPPAPSLTPTSFNSSVNNIPNGFPGTFTIPQPTNLGSIPGQLSGGSLTSAWGLLGSTSQEAPWLNNFGWGLANSGFTSGGSRTGSGMTSTGNGGGTASSGGSQPLTVNAWPYQGSAVTNITIQEVGDENDEANNNFYAGDNMEQSETLWQGEANAQYQVSVTWANGATYQQTVNNVGMLTVTQP